MPHTPLHADQCQFFSGVHIDSEQLFALHAGYAIGSWYESRHMDRGVGVVRHDHYQTAQDLRPSGEGFIDYNRLRMAVASTGCVGETNKDVKVRKQLC
jgi:hypothetical protein